MSRNWAASENPPRHFKPTARHLRDLALRRAIDEEARSVYVPLNEMPWPYVVALAEGIERFRRMNPTNSRGV